MSPPTLFSPLALGDMTLPNRIILPALTRARADAGGVPSDVMVEYYVQRASAGLIVSEGTFTSARAIGWEGAPGVYTAAQVAGWRKVTDAVHAAGGRMFCQLWHCGRASHARFRDGADGDARPVAASAVAMGGDVRVPGGGKVPAEEPRALETEEVGALAAEYAHAARCAKEAGFDGVEVHCANGYLLNGFLETRTNLRTDKYGGSKEARFRVVREVVQGVCGVFPSGRVGVKMSPNGVFNDMGSAEFREDYEYYIGQVRELEVGYLCAMTGLAFGFHGLGEAFTCADVRRAYGGGVVMANCGYDRAAAEREVGCGAADCVAFGRPYISNPDLVARFAARAELEADADVSVWYSAKEGKEAKAVGYTDFPTMKKGSNV